ncbi:MAG: hypothetical protein AAGD06_32685, partial [Acidobacteriota bacterium]
MITGSNTVFEHNGKEYHLQAEDLGAELGVFEIRVYTQGTVLWQKRMPYADLLEQGLGQKDLYQALRTKMEKTL